MENHIEIYKKLTVPLPKEAVRPHPTKTYLSTIKAIYVTERFNEVFGIDGWSIKTDLLHWFEKTTAKGRIEYTAVCKTIFTTTTGIYHECIAGSTNEDLGDAAKGSTTDAITKIGSYLGVGIDVFKGLTPPDKKASAPKAPITPKAAPKKLDELTPTHKSWEYVVQRVKAKVDIATIKKSFTLSEENEAKLINEAK